jgi:hypothetical protein
VAAEDFLYRRVTEKTIFLLQQKILRQDWLLSAILNFVGEFGIYDDVEAMTVKVKNHKRLRDTMINKLKTIQEYVSKYFCM